MRQLTVEKNDAGQRLDKFLQKSMPALPPALMYKYLRQKRVRCNGTQVTNGALRLQQGDVLCLYIRDEFFARNVGTDALARLHPQLQILYEDDNLLLVEKPAGQLVHDAEGAAPRETLISHIRAYLYQKGAYHPAQEQSFAPALCNRIDRNTAGIVIAAKNAQSLRCMDEIIRSHQIEKYYLCAVHGTLHPQTGELRGYLRKNAAANLVSVFDHPLPDGSAKLSRTVYHTLAQNDGLSLVLVRLITGRTHQIRAQFAHAGHPLLGDGKYAVNREDRLRGYTAQALYAVMLRFCIPKDGFLGYMHGKTVAVNGNHIGFLREFPDFPITNGMLAQTLPPFCPTD